jgi:hypothetical protein
MTLGIGQRSGRSLRWTAAGEVMTSTDDFDLDSYCGRVGNLYGRHGLCPPFALRQIATDWKARGIAISHIVAVIDRHLTDHPNRYYSGSGDALFSYVDELVRKTWYEQHLAPLQVKPNQPTIQRIADHEGIGRQNAENARDRNDGPVRGKYDRAPAQIARPFVPRRGQPKQIERALAFLRCELADGEVAATLLEEKAKASGISLRTLDRARARLNVISRRTGFAKEGKCWLSLPRTP